ncbi:LysR family transcriptional regulator [Microbaculum marinum]|uniref:LysR family transcriptional regulator n=1 Tax=Microbaculum marinum TaxID=1764581 RepID=A0AAW9RM41_9HYPH
MARLEKSGVDIRRLRYFFAVCDNGGFSKAAPVIGIAQPALTRQVRLLEQELGVELVTRNGRSAVPTEAGARLLGEAKTHIEELDLLFERLRQDFNGAAGDIRLGVCPTIAPLFLNHIMDSMRHGGRVSVVEAYSGDLERLMASRRLDLAISYLGANDARAENIPLLTERLVLAGPPLDVADPAPFAALAGLRLILPSPIHQLRRIVDRVAADRGVALRPALELDSLTAVKAMIEEADHGYHTVLPYHSVAADAAQGRYCLWQIDDADMVRTIALLCPSGMSDRALNGMIERVLGRAAELRDQHDPALLC